MDIKNEYKVLHEAIYAFRNNLAVPIQYEIVYSDSFEGGAKDGKVKIRIGDLANTFDFETKGVLNSSHISMIIQNKGTQPKDFLLFSQYINKNLAQNLKKNGIQFMDTVGNVFINSYPLYVDVGGNKPKNTFTSGKVKRAFQPSGLKLLFALLSNPQLINKPYREMAQTTNIALGTVGLVFRDLEDLGFLLNTGKKGRKLTNTKLLYERWCVNYNETLKPKQFIVQCSGPNKWWEDYRIGDSNGQWGGEVAASKLTHYLKPENILLYIDEEKYSDIMITNKLRKDNTGNVKIYKRFWNESDDTVVHPLLVYADLLENNDPRNIETAKIVYEKYITQYIGKS